MEFIILPLSYRSKEEKQQKIRETVELAIRIRNREQQVFALAGILAFTDKMIDRDTANKIRRAIEMTQVAQIFEEEKQQALTQVAQIFEEEKQQALTQAAHEYEKEKQQALTEIAIRMIRKGYSSKEIADLISGYLPEDVEKLQKELQEGGRDS